MSSSCFYHVSRVEILLAFKPWQTFFIRNISLSNVFLHSVWSKFKMKCCVNTMTSFCGLWEMQSGAAKCTFQLLKENKWYVKLHPKSLHIYSLRSFPHKLLEGSHMYRLRSHTSRESGVRRAVVRQPPEDFPRSGVCARLCTHYTGPGCVSCQSLVLTKSLFETWIRYKYLLGK